MEFITVRDLRSRPKAIWQRLRAMKDLVVTVNGRPIGILSEVPDGDPERALAAIRRGRAEQAVQQLQAQALAAGLDRLSPTVIAAEIAAVRKRRRQ